MVYELAYKGLNGQKLVLQYKDKKRDSSMSSSPSPRKGTADKNEPISVPKLALDKILEMQRRIN